MPLPTPAPLTREVPCCLSAESISNRGLRSLTVLVSQSVRQCLAGRASRRSRRAPGPASGVPVGCSATGPPRRAGVELDGTSSASLHTSHAGAGQNGTDVSPRSGPRTPGRNPFAGAAPIFPTPAASIRRGSVGSHAGGGRAPLRGRPRRLHARARWGLRSLTAPVNPSTRQPCPQSGAGSRRTARGGPSTRASTRERGRAGARGARASDALWPGVSPFGGTATRSRYGALNPLSERASGAVSNLK